jgi:hypothetical protein
MVSSKISIINKLKSLCVHNHVQLTARGDVGIKSVLKLFDNVLVPEEGGWISYKKLPKSFEMVKCDNARINLDDLKQKLEDGKDGNQKHKFDAIIYQNPGGYFAEQPINEIYQLCAQFNCKVIMDVSGAIGTKLCDGNYADFMVASFGKWKLIDAGKGGFVSSKTQEDFVKLQINEFNDEKVLNIINKKLSGLDDRIKKLVEIRKKVLSDLSEFDVLWPRDLGFVVVVEFVKDVEKQKIIDYCIQNKLEYTQCPRYIRVNKPAISIEIKRLYTIKCDD